MNSAAATLSVVTALVMLTLVVTKETIVPMNKDDSKCGEVFVVGPSHDLRLTGSGYAPGGYCGVTVYAAPEQDNYTCDAICVTFKTASLNTCDVKIKFVGHKFREEGDLVREFNCHQKDKNSFCWNVGSLRMEVIEDYVYAYKYQSQPPLYEFNIDAAARCSKDSVARKVFHASREEFEARERKTYGEGIAVGVSLACIFLIVLFIAWCYTKHQAVTSGPSDTNQSRKKGSIISSFRSKLHIKKKSDASGEPQATYRKTETSYEAPPAKGRSDPEAPTELSPLTETKDGAETYELASETLKTDQQNESPKDGGQESPKDGGDEAAKLSPPEVVVVPGTPEPRDENETVLLQNA